MPGNSLIQLLWVNRAYMVFAAFVVIGMVDGIDGAREKRQFALHTQFKALCCDVAQRFGKRPKLFVSSTC